MKAILALLLLAAFSLPNQLSAQTFNSFLEYCTHRKELNDAKRATVEAVIDNILLTQSTFGAINQDKVDCFEVSNQLRRTKILALRNHRFTFFPQVTIVDDLEVLGVLKHLEKLSIHGAFDKKLDLKPLTKLGIKTLEIKTGILDPSELENIESLESLTILDTELPDVKNLKKLTNLHVKFTPSKLDISKLGGANQLKELRITADHPHQFTPIRSTQAKNDFPTQMYSSNIEAFRVNVDPISVARFKQRPQLQHKGPALSLTDIDFMNQLTLLEISGTTLENGEQLKNLTNLEILVLRNIHIQQDLAFTKNSKLETVELISVFNLNTKSFENTSKIKRFIAAYTDLNEIIDLANNKDLIELSIPGTSLQNIKGMKNFQKLKALNLSGNHVYLYEVSLLKDLKLVNLNNTGMVDDYALISSKNIEVLLAHSNQIKSIESLSGMDNLKEVDLHKNRIMSIDPLFNKNKIESLSLSQNRIHNLTPIATMGALQRVPNLRLDLSSNKIASLKSLTKLYNLSYLNMSDNAISDIDDISSLGNLEEINLNNNFIEDISSMKWLNKVQRISLYNNRIEDVQPLSKLVNLNGRLELSLNRITDISSLSNLSKELRITLRGNPIKSRICPTVPNKCEF